MDAISVGARPGSLDLESFGMTTVDVLEVDVHLCTVQKVDIPCCHVAAFVYCHSL